MRYSKAALALMDRGLNLRTIADELSVRPQSVSRWLAGQSPPPPELYDVLAALSDANFALEIRRLSEQAHRLSEQARR